MLTGTRKANLYATTDRLAWRKRFDQLGAFIKCVRLDRCWVVAMQWRAKVWLRVGRHSQFDVGCLFGAKVFHRDVDEQRHTCASCTFLW